MDWYHRLRPLLFSLEPETAHGVAFGSLQLAQRLGILQYLVETPISSSLTVAGIRFPNAVGLAAGLDKNGDYIDALAQLGFGFIEIGTVTPRPQSGNPKPRLFRLPQHRAIINRLGFNNRGVDYLISRIKRSTFSGVLGINIGKNLDTPVAGALSDYLLCLQKVYPYASYITVNISSPNTPGLRDLQYGSALHELLEPLKQAQAKLSQTHGYKPVFVKIAPDMDAGQIASVADCLLDCEVDGVIATNTTVSRPQPIDDEMADEAGGLSGEPLTDLATQTLQSLTASLHGRLPVIGVGGISDAGTALDKLQAGASLVQIYTGFIYQGPGLITECARAIAQYRHKP